MLTRSNAVAPGLYPNEAYALIPDKGIEKPEGIGAPAYARHQRIGKAPEGVEALGSGFLADYGLKISDNHGIGMGAGDGANDVMGMVNVRHPISHGLIHGVLKGFRA
jgi:hypothetical protein